MDLQSFDRPAGVTHQRVLRRVLRNSESFGESFDSKIRKVRLYHLDQRFLAAPGVHWRYYFTGAPFYILHIFGVG